MLQLINVYKNYTVDKKPFPALKNINVAFGESGFVSILGPSGCGKTTLLNLIGGLDHYTKGDLLINGKSTKKFKDKDWDAYRNKKVGFVFQTYNLIPHLTILENVQISLSLAGVSASEKTKRAMDLLDKVGLKDIAKKKPNQLSGGQMQRVAIARALVNDPEIVLADEPTGALDSKTSVQVMDILKEVSKTKLVIMVTHNNELANQYSTRIINLLDGEIVSDSDPLKVEENKTGDEKLKRTHMNFFQSLSMSFKNLLTKKGRTALTAIASSFGIIGVALVLAIQNGFTNYIGRVESSTAASLPITIAPYSTKTIIDEYKSYVPYPEEKEIIVYQAPQTEEIITHRNYITQEYVDYLDSIKDDGYIASVLYNHDTLDFNIVTQYGNMENAYIKVNQYAGANGMSSVISSISGLPSSIFYELYGEEDYLRTMYDVIDGHFPQNKNEVVLVTNKFNQIPLNTLYRLGYFEDFDNVPETLSFEDIYAKEFKAFVNSNFYINPQQTTVDAWQLDTEYMMADLAAQQLVHEITGKEIDYLHAIRHEDVQKTITTYSTRNVAQLYNDSSLVEGKDYIDIKVVGVLRPREDSLLSLLPNSIGYTRELKDFFVEANEKSEVTQNVSKNWYIPQDEAAWNNFIDAINLFIEGQTNVEDLSETDVMSMVNGMYKFVNATGAELNITQFMNHCKVLGAELPVDRKIINGEIEISAQNITEIKNSLDEIRDNFVNYLAYFLGYSRVTSIVIFPATLDAKAVILKKLDEFNKGKSDSEQILYTDLIGTITDSIATMINVISIVLIVFSSISLVVSCVMTGIITYISVIERTKEIGILRAVGARKTDVGGLFEAESMIVGFISGIIGVLATYLISIPVNLILNAQFPDAAIGNIAALHPLHAVLLVVVSIGLTFISGLIPSRAAARKDPVVALRTE